MSSKSSADDEAEAKDDLAPNGGPAESKGSSASPGSPAKPEVGERPPTGLLQGYTQTYLIWKVPRKDEGTRAGGESKSGGRGRDFESDDDECEHEVLFRCGNWCYTGHVVLDRVLRLSDMPLVIPLLQRQQSRLHYYCSADGIPPQSSFAAPMRLVSAAADYAAAALSSEAVTAELAQYAELHSWVEDPDKTFFEMALNVADLPECMENVELVCSKTYARGLVFLTMLFEGSLYVSIQDGEGEQPLLDVKFPDVSHHGQGVQLGSAPALCGARGSFDGAVPPPWYGGLTLWHVLPSEVKVPPPRLRNLSTPNYTQMYLVLKPRAENGGFAVTSAYREVLFRFGSWCYGGSIQLVPTIRLSDVPYVIPALRMQQSRLEFVYAADQVPSTSPFVKPMGYLMTQTPVMEAEISKAEDVLAKLVDRLTSMGLGDSISSWLEGDASQSFFEFQVSLSGHEASILEPVELMASKTYYASGIVLVLVYFSGAFYVVVNDGGNEQPLLDSKFPDVSSKGRGYQITSYPEGTDQWEGLRKVSIWQSTEAMQAEMEARLGAEAAAEAAESASGTLATDAAVTRLEASAATVTASSSSSSSSSNNNAAAPPSSRAEAKAEAKDSGDGDGGGGGGVEAKAQAKSGGGGGGGGYTGGHGDGLGDEQRATRQSLGAFHRLQPMSQLKKLHSSDLGSDLGAAPWDASGRPLAFGKSGGGATSPFGKPVLGSPDFKKGPP